MSDLPLLVIQPDQSGYAIAKGVSVLSTQLNGGASRYRKDIQGATSTVSVSWTVDGYVYQYLLAFCQTDCAEGALPFEIDLILDEPILTRHKAYFTVGNTPQLKSKNGLTYVVGAQLEVYPNAPNVYNRDLIDLFTLAGACWMNYEDILDRIVNTLLPEVL